MAGSLYSMVRDWDAGEFMVVVSGYVSRGDVMSVDSPFTTIEGETEHDVDDVNDAMENAHSDSYKIKEGEGKLGSLTHLLRAKKMARDIVRRRSCAEHDPSKPASDASDVIK